MLSRSLVLGRALVAGIVVAGLFSGAPASAAVDRPQDAKVAMEGETHGGASRVEIVQPTGRQATADEDDGTVPHITVSRAADLVGRPVDIFRPKSLLPPPGSGEMPSGMPVAGSRLTSGFGLRMHPILGGWREHLGIDLAAPYGTPIVATDDGVVGRARWAGGYGLSVSIEGAGGMETRYGHMSRISVSAGESVRKGEVIGYVGSTGLSTGPHVHYEVRVNGRPVNPARFIKKK